MINAGGPNCLRFRIGGYSRALYFGGNHLAVTSGAENIPYCRAAVAQCRPRAVR